MDPISAIATTTTTQARRLRVGELARQTGKTVRAIHLYEEMGLLEPAMRSAGGFRLYDPAAVERLRWIDLLHTAGFSLHEMREVLRTWWSAELGSEAMGRLREIFEKKLEETREAIRRHQQLERELLDGLAYLKACGACGTTESTVGCVCCDRDHGMAAEPVLLAGLKTRPDRTARPRSNRSDFVPLREVLEPPGAA
jgi:DNA-binding transcriptional MerR regulator